MSRTEAFKGAVENQTGAKVLVLKPGEYKDI
ncbi:hypothetical protein N752_14120 [Desulforamulus aquiferis]|nr:hypothetical protein N752_14120 [Desulforamulus aquiferis]